MSDEVLPPAEYLGDGVYASFDGYQIWLAANHPHSNQRVALEPEVYAALLQYADRVKAFYAARAALGATP